MILNTPRILELSIRPLEPLGRLDTVLTSSHQRHNTLRVEPSRIVDSLQEDVVQPIDNGTVLRSRSRNLINRLHSKHTALTSQLSSNLIPKLGQPLLHHSHVSTGVCQIQPIRAVVMHIDDCVKASGKNHINNIFYSLQPLRVDCPFRRLTGEVECPGNRQTNALVARLLDVVER
jgi:hypothetical protein